MNKEDIIRMAREAGMAYRERIQEFNTPLMDGVHCEELERFAALVAAAEREACAKVADRFHVPMCDTVSDLIAVAIRARGQA